MAGLHVLVGSLDTFNLQMFGVLLLVILFQSCAKGNLLGFVSAVADNSQLLVHRHLIFVHLGLHARNRFGSKDVGYRHRGVLHLPVHQLLEVFTHLRIHEFGVHAQQIIVDAESFPQLPSVFLDSAESLGPDVKSKLGLK